MILRWMLRAIAAVEVAARTLAATMTIVVMLIVVIDVVLRYVFNSPLTWAYDFVSLYLMVGIFFLVLSEAYISGAHVAVDLIMQHMSPRVRWVAQIVINASSVGVFVLIAWAAAHQLAQSYTENDALAGTIAWRTWPGYALVLFGSSMLAVRLVLQFFALLASLIAGRNLFPDASPKPHASGEGE